jgi:hypothetical protein
MTHLFSESLCRRSHFSCFVLDYIVAAAKSVLRRIQRHSQRASTRSLQAGDDTLPQFTTTQSQSPLRTRLGENGSSSPLSHRASPLSAKKKKATAPSQTLSPALSTKKRKATTPSQTCKKPKTETSDSPGKAAAAQVIWSGPPDEKLDGGWPQGWIKKIYNRSRGPRIDRYWYSPKNQFKLRSMVECRKFIAALVEHSGDEQAAFQIARNK